MTTGTVFTGTTGGGTQKQQTYGYDAFGNIQSIGGDSARSTPTQLATNQLQGSAEYDYAGNLTAWNGNTYEYDAFNMMKRMVSGNEEWLYAYTADDERVWQFDAAAVPRFDRWTIRDLGGSVLRTYEATGWSNWHAEKDYIYRDGNLLAAETPAGTRHFHLDHLGTPRLITDSNGDQIAYHIYYPFGEEATDPFQDQETMKFTGHERDLNNPDGTGEDLDYMHARFCSPVTGRFMSKDPAYSANPLSPQTWNLYAYAGNNPIKYIDPTGLATYLLIAGEGFLATDMQGDHGDVGDLFTLAAETRAAEIEASSAFDSDSDAVEIVKATTGAEFADAMNATYQSGPLQSVEVFSHAFGEGINLGGGPAGTTDKLFMGSQVDQLSPDFAPNATVKFCGCNSALGSPSIAEAFSSSFGIAVTGSNRPTHFDNSDRSRPVHQVTEGQWVTFTP